MNKESFVEQEADFATHGGTSPESALLHPPHSRIIQVLTPEVPLTKLPLHGSSPLTCVREGKFEWSFQDLGDALIGCHGSLGRHRFLGRHGF